MAVKVPHLDRKEQRKSCKTFSYVFLTLFHLEGILSLIIGIVLILECKASECSFFRTFYVTISLILSSGALIVIFCTIGMLNTLNSNKNMKFRHYTWVFSIVLILELASAIKATADHNYLLNNEFHQFLLGDFSQFSNFATKETKCWENIQVKYECCGFNGYTDWIQQSSNLSVETGQKGLASCSCNEEESDSENCIDISHVNVSIDVNAVYSESCYNSLYSQLELQSVILRAAGPCLSVTQITFTLFSVFMVRKMKRTNAIKQIHAIRYQAGAESKSQENFSRF